jgi:hypothetical protein
MQQTVFVGQDVSKQPPCHATQASHDAAFLTSRLFSSSISRSRASRCSSWDSCEGSAGSVLGVGPDPGGPGRVDRAPPPSPTLDTVPTPAHGDHTGLVSNVMCTYMQARQHQHPGGTHTHLGHLHPAQPQTPRHRRRSGQGQMEGTVPAAPRPAGPCLEEAHSGPHGAQGTHWRPWPGRHRGCHCLPLTCPPVMQHTPVQPRGRRHCPATSHCPEMNPGHHRQAGTGTVPREGRTPSCSQTRPRGQRHPRAHHWTHPGHHGLGLQRSQDPASAQ